MYIKITYARTYLQRILVISRNGVFSLHTILVNVNALMAKLYYIVLFCLVLLLFGIILFSH